MQTLPRWQLWRLRCLLVAKSTTVQDPLRSQGLSRPLHGRRFIASPSDAAQHQDLWVAQEIKQRVNDIQQSGLELYPRRAIKHRPMTLARVDRTYQRLKRGQAEEDGGMSSFQGRVETVRTAGRLLFFVDMVRKSLKIQVLVNHMQMLDSSTEEEFFARRKLLRRGDVISVAGYPYRAQSGQLSIRAAELPCVLSPCLHKFPVQKSPEETSSENESQFLDRHVEMLANYKAGQLLMRRSQIIREIRDFLNRGGFTEVQTPILSTRAGGAIARPFETFASEFPEKRLSLRVAPELWLKRLLVGGMESIFEIGPCFRNEGLDKTHNPEFTTCEFYLAYSSIQDLLRITETMLRTVVRNVHSVSAEYKDDPNRLARIKLPPPTLEAQFFKGPYPRIDFIPALNEALGLKLPDLAAESALPELTKIFQEKEIAFPAQSTIPRLLDKLSSAYLEPQCNNPTWIINYPECLSPLSKSFVHPSPDVAQPVAARAELFVHGREIVNCYEEENSPFEQRRKFMMQQRYANALDNKTPDPEVMEVDEAYLKALEWGLPPTGGWGCGIDRLVMLLTEKQRINDVLTFGNLRSVTRTPEQREMVKLPGFTAATSNEKVSQHGNLEVTRAGRKDDPDADGSAESQIDAVEEAVLVIKKKLNKDKSGLTEQSTQERTGPNAKRKRLSDWLARQMGRGAKEKP